MSCFEHRLNTGPDKISPLAQKTVTVICQRSKVTDPNKFDHANSPVPGKLDVLPELTPTGCPKKDCTTFASYKIETIAPKI